MDRGEQQFRAIVGGALEPDHQLRVVGARPGAQPRHDHVIELQALGLVDRHDLEQPVGVGLGRREQRLQRLLERVRRRCGRRRRPRARPDGRRTALRPRSSASDARQAGPPSSSQACSTRSDSGTRARERDRAQQHRRPRAPRARGRPPTAGAPRSALPEQFEDGPRRRLPPARRGPPASARTRVRAARRATRCDPPGGASARVSASRSEISGRLASASSSTAVGRRPARWSSAAISTRCERARTSSAMEACGSSARIERTISTTFVASSSGAAVDEPVDEDRRIARSPRARRRPARTTPRRSRCPALRQHAREGVVHPVDDAGLRAEVARQLAAAPARPARCRAPTRAGTGRPRPRGNGRSTASGRRRRRACGRRPRSSRQTSRSTSSNCVIEVSWNSSISRWRMRASSASAMSPAALVAQRLHAPGGSPRRSPSSPPRRTRAVELGGRASQDLDDRPHDGPVGVRVARRRKPAQFGERRAKFIVAPKRVGQRGDAFAGRVDSRVFPRPTRPPGSLPAS